MYNRTHYNTVFLKMAQVLLCTLTVGGSKSLPCQIKPPPLPFFSFFFTIKQIFIRLANDNLLLHAYEAARVCSLLYLLVENVPFTGQPKEISTQQLAALQLPTVESHKVKLPPIFLVSFVFCSSIFIFRRLKCQVLQLPSGSTNRSEFF